MLYTRFALIGPSRWAVLSNSKQVADIALTKDGRCSVSSHAMNREELASVQEFVEDTERKKI